MHACLCTTVCDRKRAQTLLAKHIVPPGLHAESVVGGAPAAGPRAALPSLQSHPFTVRVAAVLLCVVSKIRLFYNMSHPVGIRDTPMRLLVDVDDLPRQGKPRAWLGP